MLHITAFASLHTSQRCLLCDSFEGLQYQVCLMDKPVGTDEDVYCPASQKEKSLCIGLS